MIEKGPQHLSQKSGGGAIGPLAPFNDAHVCSYRHIWLKDVILALDSYRMTTRAASAQAHAK